MSAVSTFQDAKDTFYVTLRDRLAALNPERTVVVRGAVRPGLLVEENEIAGTPVPVAEDAFVLSWTGFAIDTDEAVPLERGRCEIRYGTRGMPEVAGMDRGRTLQAMSEELQSVLKPQWAVRLNYAAPGADTPRTGATRVFWSDAAYGDAAASADLLRRTATVDVFAWKEDL